jgi:hypothetical protein
MLHVSAQKDHHGDSHKNVKKRDRCDKTHLPFCISYVQSDDGTFVPKHAAGLNKTVFNDKLRLCQTEFLLANIAVLGLFLRHAGKDINLSVVEFCTCFACFA